MPFPFLYFENGFVCAEKNFSPRECFSVGSQVLANRKNFACRECEW